MPTTKSFDIKPVNAANTIASRYKRTGDQPPPAPEPSYKDDIIERINIEQNVQLNDGPTIIIDVQPDYRYPICALTYHVSRVYATLDQRNNPIVTPASLTAYCLSLLYGFALITDSENVRTSKSEFANEYATEPIRRDLLTTLERAYVPPFMENILTGLMPTYDPRRPNVLFANTLAGFNLPHDYGRTFPITALLKAHHLVATNPTNANPSDVLTKWINTVVVTKGSTIITIANLIGAATTGGTYNNWFQTRLRSLFNPVTSRSNTNRPTFSPMPTFSYENSFDVNPYIYLLGADDDNIHTVSTFISSMSTIVKEQLSGSKQLGSLFDTPSGVQILTHFHHGPALPTWHFFTTSKTDPFEDITPTAFAKTLNFLTEPRTEKTPATELKYPQSDDDIDTQLYLVCKPTEDDPKAETDTFVTFNTRQHVVPDVRYFDPYDYSPSKLAFTIMDGLCTETEELDGFIVPQPDLNASLATENSHILNSAIQLKKITTALTIGNSSRIALINRTTSEETLPRVGLSLYDYSKNRLPYFKTKVNDKLPNGLFGFSPLKNLTFFKHAFSYIGFLTPNMDTKEPPHQPEHRFYAWSSYRYTNTNVKRATAQDLKVYMLLNFRTVYGTNVTMSQSGHPSRLIPTA